MGAVDPTYPLYPIASILSATMLDSVLLTSFVRQNWNLGVTFLCFWTLLENLTYAVNAIIWSDNADVKHYIYCDIVSHLQLITFIVKPMATLIITRRLYLIASLQSVDLPDRATMRWNSVVEWTLGLFVPFLVAGPIYYVHQGMRFQVDEGFGCASGAELSILSILTMDAWTVIPPLISVLFFYLKVARIFNRQRRDVHSFLNSSTSISRTNYLRILVLASIDILLTLPFSIVNLILSINSVYAQDNNVPLYLGWTVIHTEWEPISVPYAELKTFRPAQLAESYFPHWSSTVLAFVIFGLFGLTAEARSSYWRIIRAIGDWTGWKSTPRTRGGENSLGEIEFGARTLQDVVTTDVEMGSGRPSFVTNSVPLVKRNSGHNLVISEKASESESVPTEDVHSTTGSDAGRE